MLRVLAGGEMVWREVKLKLPGGTGSDTAYTLKALALAGAFDFFNHLTIGLKRYPIPGTIDLQKVALMSYSAGTNQQ